MTDFLRHISRNRIGVNNVSSGRRDKYVSDAIVEVFSINPIMLDVYSIAYNSCVPKDFASLVGITVTVNFYVSYPVVSKPALVTL